MNLKKIISDSNQNADFTLNYEKNKALKKKLYYIGSPLTIAGFIVAATAFILIGIFGSDLKSIALNTPVLISMFVLLVVFSVAFGVGLYILRQASFLHLTKPEEKIIEEKQEVIEIKEENKK